MRSSNGDSGMSEQLIFPAARTWPRRWGRYGYCQLERYLVWKGYAASTAQAAVLISGVIEERMQGLPGGMPQLRRLMWEVVK